MSGGGPDSAPQGGEAWKFYSALRVMLRVFTKEKSKQWNGITGKQEEMVTGAIVLAKLDKCKVSDSVHQEQKFYLRSGTGIDNARSVIDLAIGYSVVTKRGGWHDWHTAPGGLVSKNGVDAFHKHLMSDPTILPILFSQVAPKLSGSAQPIPTLEDAMAEAEILDEDLFSIVPGMEKIEASPPEEDPE